MADVVTPQRRSEIMSHIKSKNTSVELIVRRKLFSLGYRFRVNYKDLAGKPDIVFTKKKIAIFINGCYWHGHDIGCRFSHESKTRPEYWQTKIQNTKARDEKHYQSLTNGDWKVIVIWECEIRLSFDDTLNRLINFLNVTS